MLTASLSLLLTRPTGRKPSRGEFSWLQAQPLTLVSPNCFSQVQADSLSGEGSEHLKGTRQTRPQRPGSTSESESGPSPCPGRGRMNTQKTEA